MADANEFYSYRSDVRKAFSDYGATSSKTLEGSQTIEQQVKLVYLNLLMICSDVIEYFDPTTSVHMFNADEMRDFMRIINDIVDRNDYVNFDQYY